MENGSDPRHLKIRTSRAGEDAIVVAVENTGPSIPADTLERSFESFFTTKDGGLGLGLTISRSIVEAHGGRLWATSEDGKGTVFSFTLPVTDEEPDAGA